MKFIPILSFVCAIWAPLACLDANTESRTRPNIVFVLYDDLGYGEPQCYRDASDFQTPAMDRIAREGMRFTDAHSAASVCTPTRYGELTGRYPSRIGQYGVLTTYSKPIIPDSRLTIASLMRQNGYDTACFGKWHLGMDWGNRSDQSPQASEGTRLVASPNAAGFDYFYGFTHSRNMALLIEQDQVVSKIQDIQTQPTIASKIVGYLDDPARRQKPFFLYLPLCPPHTPVVPAPEYAGKGSRSGATDPYADWVHQGDQVLKQVLDALDRQQLAKNTLLFVTSDNGAEKRVYEPLRGAKRSIYEGGHRVPFLVRWPAKVQAGSECKQTICLNDLMATCADILGVSLPENAGEDSFSILPQLLGSGEPMAREYTIHQSIAQDLAIRQGPWKLIFLKSGARELYHLETDLGEERNVLTEHPEIVERLTKQMKKTIADGRSTPGPPQATEAVISLDGEPEAKRQRKIRPKGSKQKSSE